jgi:hypothetical protein
VEVLLPEIAEVLGGTRRGIEVVPWHEYISLAALNPSTIAHGVPPKGSMLHLKNAWDNGRADSESMLWGRAVHCLLFEPREFESRYWEWSGKKSGKEFKSFESEAWEAHAEVLSSEGRYSVAAAMKAAKAVIREPLVKRLISAGQPEITVFDVEGSVQCRGRLDWVSTAENCIVDLKTAKAVDARSFGRDFYGYFYDVKLGLYRRWLSRVSGKPWRVEVMCVENCEPYDVTVVPIDDAVLDRGADKGLKVIEMVEDCIKTDQWPGVAGGKPYYLDTPVWEMDEEIVGFDEQSP